MEFVGMDNWRGKEVARLLALVEAERRYFREMLARFPEAMAVVAADGSLVLANRAFRRMFGLDALTGETRQLETLAPLPGLREAVEVVLAGGGGRSLDYRAVPIPAGDGDLRVWLQPYSDWDESAERQVVLVVQDVTTVVSEARRQAEQRTAAAIEKLGSLPAVAWRVDPATMKFAEVAEEAARRLGLPAEHWRSGADFWSDRVEAGDLVRLRGIHGFALGGGVLRACDYRARNASGETIWLRDLLRFIRNEQGTVTAIEGLTIDVTSARRMAESIEQAAKADAISRVSAGVVHEGNNLLTILSGFGEELLNGLAAGSPLRVNVQEILGAGARLSALLARLGPVSTRSVLEARAVQVEALLSRVTESVRPKLVPGVDLKLEMNAPGAALLADPEFLERLIRVLVERAVRSIPKGGSITLGTRFEEVADASAAEDFPVGIGERVVIEVRDSGPSIHSDALARVFEPAETNDPGRPALASLYLTTVDSGGDMRVQSVHGQGTVFEISFPRVSAKVLEAEHPRAEAEPAPSSEVVLVVDDEPGIRTLIHKTLQRSGYEAIEAANGQEALSIARSHDGPIHLLLTDVVMPEMGGVELARAMQPLRPGLKVLFISGYTGPSSLDTGAFPSGAAFLQKPFTLAALLAKVKDLLGTRDSNRASA